MYYYYLDDVVAFSRSRMTIHGIHGSQSMEEKYACWKESTFPEYSFPIVTKIPNEPEIVRFYLVELKRGNERIKHMLEELASIAGEMTRRSLYGVTKLSSEKYKINKSPIEDFNENMKLKDIFEQCKRKNSPLRIELPPVAFRKT